MRKVIAALLLLVVPSNALADVKYLLIGQPAPFTGYLFDRDKETVALQAVQGLGICQKKLSDLDEEFSLQQQMLQQMGQRVLNFQTENASLARLAIETKTDNFWRSALYFGLGVVVTGAIAIGVNHSTR